jgi:hypothetical protein
VGEFKAGENEYATPSSPVPIQAGMSSTLGRHFIRFGPFQVEWFHGAGFAPSHLIWRYRGQIVVIAGSGAA